VFYKDGRPRNERREFVNEHAPITAGNENGKYYEKDMRSLKGTTRPDRFSVSI
jgi:hypothetical protein